MGEFPALGAGIVGHDMAFSVHAVFVNNQAFHSHRSPRVGFIGADAEFGAETKPVTVGKAVEAL